MSLDDQLYDIVAKEIRSGTLVDGLYTRAFADANGDKDKAQAKYIKLRVAQLRTEHKGKGKADSNCRLWYPLDHSLEVGLAAPVKKLLSKLTKDSHPMTS